MRTHESWEQTLVALAEQSRLMDVIHGDWPGKENRQKRETLLRPHRAECIRLHYRRIEINEIIANASPAI